jgi:hypothetical protein
METIIRKNRTRQNRGELKNFHDLPKEHQGIFLEIKNLFCDFLGEKTNLYVFGSFFWGFWDEKSDYDVLFDYPNNCPNLEILIETIKKTKDKINNEYNVKAHIMTMREERGILIP